MSVFMKLIIREEVRIEKMLSEYIKELKSLPKGKITPKIVNGKTYYYLYYRDGKKVVSKYIGKDCEKLTSISDQLTRRRQIEEIIRKLEEEKKKIKKMEAML